MRARSIKNKIAYNYRGIRNKKNDNFWLERGTICKKIKIAPSDDDIFWKVHYQNSKSGKFLEKMRFHPIIQKTQLINFQHNLKACNFLIDLSS